MISTNLFSGRSRTGVISSVLFAFTALVLIFSLSSCASPVKSDADQVRDEATSFVSSVFSTRTAKAELLDTEDSETAYQIENLSSLGIDMDRVAEAYAKKISLEVTEVEVDGNTARVSVVNYMPVGNDEGTVILQEEFSTVDPNGDLEAYGDAMVRAINRDDFPIEGQLYVLIYKKENGLWQLINGNILSDAIGVI